MFDLKELQRAITRENLEGWLFFNFQHRDRFSDHFLGIPDDRMNSRSWFYLVPARGEPVAVCHSIEPDTLAGLPGQKNLYSGREELAALLGPLACRCGAAYSLDITALSYLDHGTALFLESLGFRLVPSEGLIQRAVGLLSPAQMDTHEEAAGHLYRIVRECWERIRTAFREGQPLTERQVQEWILEDFRVHGLVTEHRPVVAAGPNSGNPHYEPGENSRVLAPGDPVQFDLWAKLPGPDAVFADISWMGCLAEKPDPALEKRFALICRARDGAVDFIRSRLAAGNPPAGREVDAAVREILISAGEAERIWHRTGHGIDRAVHGWGVNLDSVEFPDHRPLLEGACFSIEPGLYDSRFGCRTEINGCIRGGELHISGGPIQHHLLLLG